MKKNLYIFWDRKSVPRLDEFKMGRNFVYSDSRAIDSMDVVPLAKPASMPMLPIEEKAIEVKKKFAYFLYAGRIYYGECVDIGGLVFDNLKEVKTEDGEPLKVDNFFVFGNKVWFATRFELKMGDLDSRGKIIKNVVIVQGIPKHTDIEYYHILRCCIGEMNGSYKMFTEETLMESKRIGPFSMNYHSRICEYTSDDLLTWQFQRVLHESYKRHPYEKGKSGDIQTKQQEMKMFRQYDSTEVEVLDLSNLLQKNIEAYGTDFVLVDKEFRAYILENETTSYYQSDDGVVWKNIGFLSFLDKPWVKVRFLCWGDG